jgi:hypothetical protein
LVSEEVAMNKWYELFEEIRLKFDDITAWKLLRGTSSKCDAPYLGYYEALKYMVLYEYYFEHFPVNLN